MKLQSKSEDDTKNIGRDLGKRLKRGDVVCLCGELGSGKTTITKGIASALGIDEREITSASFTIIAEHEAETPLYHIDLYRVSAGDISELGLHEYIGKEGISVIEWAERAESEMPEESIIIILKHTGDNSRDIEIIGIR
ncbi:MAG: tsaE [Nitrospirae bacterium]|nr:tsaE [Nitrospirota bacterium]